MKVLKNRVKLMTGKSKKVATDIQKMECMMDVGEVFGTDRFCHTINSMFELHLIRKGTIHPGWRNPASFFRRQTEKTLQKMNDGDDVSMGEDIEKKTLSELLPLSQTAHEAWSEEKANESTPAKSIPEKQKIQPESPERETFSPDIVGESDPASALSQQMELDDPEENKEADQQENSSTLEELKDQTEPTPNSDENEEGHSTGANDDSEQAPDETGTAQQEDEEDETETQPLTQARPSIHTADSKQSATAGTKAPGKKRPLSPSAPEPVTKKSPTRPKGSNAKSNNIRPPSDDEFSDD